MCAEESADPRQTLPAPPLSQPEAPPSSGVMSPKSTGKNGQRSRNDEERDEVSGEQQGEGEGCRALSDVAECTVIQLTLPLPRSYTTNLVSSALALELAIQSNTAPLPRRRLPCRLRPGNGAEASPELSMSNHTSRCRNEKTISVAVVGLRHHIQEVRSEMM